MQIIQRMKIWKDLKRLEQRVRDEPSPSTFVDLGQVFINLESYDKALRVAEDGLALFPRSAELKKLLDCARRGIGRQRAAELRAKLTRSPNPRLYRELAELQTGLDDTAALQTTCQEWGKRFPDDSGSWLMLGQAKLSGYYRDLAAADGREAMRCLERAIALNGNELMARRLLGELLYRIGSVHRAVDELTTMQELHCADADLEDLLRHVQALQDHGDDIDDLLAEIEERGSLCHAPAALGGNEGWDPALTSVRESLGQVAEIPGVQKAAYIKGGRALVKGAIRDGRDPFLRVARVVAKAAHRFARRLDIGSACKSVVDGDFGHICVCVYGEVLACVLCDAGTDVEHVLAELQEIVAGALFSEGATGS